MKRQDQSEGLADQGQDKRRPKRTRRPGIEKWHIYFEPEDPNENQVFVTSIPGDREPDRYIEKSDDCPAGDYYTFKAGPNGHRIESHRYTKKDRSENPPVLDDEETELAADDFEAEETEEIAPAAGLDVRELSRVIRSEVRREFEEKERRERAGKEQPGVVDLLREVEEMAEKRLERERQREERLTQKILSMMPQQQTDQVGVFMGMFDKMLNVADRIAPIRDSVESSKGTLGHLADFTKDLFHDAAHSPYVGPVLQAGLQRAVMPQPGETAAPQQAGGVEVQQQAMDGAAVLNIIITDLKRGKRVGRSADAIEDYLSHNPSMQEQFDLLLNRQPAEILTELSQLAGEDLSSYNGSLDFIEDLKAELSPEEEETEDDSSIAVVVEAKAKTA